MLLWSPGYKGNHVYVENVKKINDVLQCPVISLPAVDDSSRQQDYSTSCSTVDTMERMPLNM